MKVFLAWIPDRAGDDKNENHFSFFNILVSYVSEL